ncbi:hypothetical protein GVN16_05510 [Emticicia sp. CRIBPO]|uniref:hypothetical protein n=1 Tax=Emticicia sp. CRIBPO TaxID=2683258 RepID=UPI0014133928|nr:hypothetical protein [Emticicia sp. CRIBPO]NBA85206.1 hypothetical protein [Emticicia sp. CRIBPO]
MEAPINEGELAQHLSSSGFYSIGNKVFKIEAYGSFDAEAYVRSLQHLKINADHADVTLKLIESESTGSTPPEAWWKWEDIDTYNGELLGFGEGYCAVFNSTDLSFVFIDYSSGVIIYWANDFNKLPVNETTAPLRNILSYWFRHSTFFLCHAAGVGLSNGGVLLTGKGGSGKSTSTLSCLKSDLKLAGDDFLLVDAESGRAYSLYGVAKLNADQFKRFRYLEEFIANPHQVPEEKGHVYVNEEFPEKILNEFTITSILLPTVTGKPDTYIEKCSKIDAVKALVPSSVWILKSDVQSVEKMKKLIARIPAYRLFAGTDLEQIPQQIIAHLHES